MELAVEIFVIIVAGSAVGGGIVGALLMRWRKGRRNQQVAHAEERASVLKTELDASRRAKRREKHKRDRAETDLAAATAEVDRLKAELEAAVKEVDDQADNVAVTSRELRDFQARFSDIVGLEADIATLRVIATRVPELERRLAEYEDRDADVIDLREQRSR